MGIQGLLPCLASITHTVPLKRYKGLTVAVDAMSWLHKGIYACDVKALATAQSNEKQRQFEEEQNGNLSRISKRLNYEKTQSSRHHHESSDASAAAASKCLDYVLRHAKKLRDEFDMHLVMVIDGDSLPSKGEIDKQRAKDRAKAYQDALASEVKGNKKAARKLFAQACSVSQRIRYELVQRLQDANIEFLVAPYEADAQMAKLARSGAVDLVITEDSDLLVYKCPRILFKIDFNKARGQEIELERELAKNEPLTFPKLTWTHDMFTFMCILSGCDYCEGIPGVGIKTAYKLVSTHCTPEAIFKALRMSGKAVPVEFETSFWMAYRTFRHQRVYCPQKKLVENLTPIEKDDLNQGQDANSMWPFLGPWVRPNVAQQVAAGVMHANKKIQWNELLRNPRGRITHEPTNIQRDVPRRREIPCQQKNMFRELKSVEKTKKRRAPTSESTSPPPPLREIYIDSNYMLSEMKDCTIAEEEESISFERALCDSFERAPTEFNPVPIHFSEYSSKFVGAKFATISRSAKRPHGMNARKHLSQAMERLSQRIKSVPAKMPYKRRKMISVPSTTLDRDIPISSSVSRGKKGNTVPSQSVREFTNIFDYPMDFSSGIHPSPCHPNPREVPATQKDGNEFTQYVIACAQQNYSQHQENMFDLNRYPERRRETYTSQDQYIRRHTTTPNLIDDIPPPSNEFLYSQEPNEYATSHIEFHESQCTQVGFFKGEEEAELPRALESFSEPFIVSPEELPVDDLFDVNIYFQAKTSHIPEENFNKFMNLPVCSFDSSEWRECSETADMREPQSQNLHFNQIGCSRYFESEYTGPNCPRRDKLFHEQPFLRQEDDSCVEHDKVQENGNDFVSLFPAHPNGTFRFKTDEELYSSMKHSLGWIQ
eukprot:scaffold16648_cov50-Attheya_sp.AAC.3